MTNKGRGWFNHKSQHALASKGIKTKIQNHYSMSIDEDEIIDEFEYDNNPVAVVDAWNFWAVWDKNSDLILMDYDSFNRLSQDHKKLILEHEIIERDLAKQDDDFERLSKSNMVNRYHEEANKEVAKKFNEEELKDMWKESYLIEWNQSPKKPQYEITNMVDWHMKGTGISHEDVDFSELPTVGDEYE